MQRIAAPMVGGMVTAPLLSMLVIPVLYQLIRRKGLARVPRATESGADARAAVAAAH